MEIDKSLINYINNQNENTLKEITKFDENSVKNVYNIYKLLAYNNNNNNINDNLIYYIINYYGLDVHISNFIDEKNIDKFDENIIRYFIKIVDKYNIDKEYLYSKILDLLVYIDKDDTTKYNNIMKMLKIVIEIYPDIDIKKSYNMVLDKLVLYPWEYNYYMIVKYLLENDPTINIRIKDDFIFFHACDINNVDLAKLLCMYVKEYEITVVKMNTLSFMEIKKLLGKTLIDDKNIIINYKVDSISY